ncbi:MAG TPA: hypothetical protein DD421_11410, partial [Clostridiaceae bacterium]|nr:hypothetical protein [Clostridiaceae bacterium]
YKFAILYFCFFLKHFTLSIYKKVLKIKKPHPKRDEVFSAVPPKLPNWSLMHITHACAAVLSRA